LQLGLQVNIWSDVCIYSIFYVTHTEPRLNLMIYCQTNNNLAFLMSILIHSAHFHDIIGIKRCIKIYRKTRSNKTIIDILGSVRFFCIILWHHHIFRFRRISLSSKLYKNQTSHKLHSCFKLNVVNSTWKDLISFFVYHVSTFRTSSLFLADPFWHHFKIANCSKVSFICLRVTFIGKPYDINN